MPMMVSPTIPECDMDGAYVADGGSFRDPAGRVFCHGGRIFRTVTEFGREDYEFVRESGFLSELIGEGLVVDAAEVDDVGTELGEDAACYTLEHPRLPYVSYPYEWSFEMLRAAALRHLDIQVRALDRDVALSDASAYNIQFIGAEPVFIDYLSFRRYREGEYWLGHRQFCEQFLNPLLLRALKDIPHNAWYRGQLEGIPTADLARLLSFRDKLSWRILMHVVAPAKLQSRAQGGTKKTQKPRRPLPRAAYRNMLLQLRTCIGALRPATANPTTWQDYAVSNTYASGESEAKGRFLSEFASKTRPDLLIDLGCNTGDYSERAIAAGAGRVIGFDFDQGALDAAYQRARDRKLPLTPLFLDAANPSPAQGWGHDERQSFGERGKADAVIALAFIHHLAIARNIPLDEVIGWIVGLAPSGVIEFVEKSDPTVAQMLALREDIFAFYDRAAFVAALETRARIVRSQSISEAGRTLYWFERR